MLRFLTNFFFCVLFATQLTQAQGGYKRYPTLEHFTNTWCSSCASRNPALFTYLNGQAGNHHHMSVHTNVPYQGCLLYQHNVADNTARKSYYSANSSPQLYLNGTFASSGTTLLPAATFTAALNQTSPIGIRVTETTGPSRTATVEVHTSGTVPAGTYVLHVIALEKTLNYASPNGEQVHYNVLRKMLTPTAGAPITLAANGAAVTSTHTYSMNAAWNAAEMYVIAFVQNTATKEVLNSGTRFDAWLTATDEAQTEIDLGVAPNPARDFLRLNTTTPMQSVEVFTLQGKRVFEQSDVQQTTQRIDVIDWKSGIYLVRVRTREGVRTQKVVVD